MNAGQGGFGTESSPGHSLAADFEGGGIEPHVASAAEFAEDDEVGDGLAEVNLVARVGPVAGAGVALVLGFGGDDFAASFVFVGFAVREPLPSQAVAGFALADDTQARAAARVAAAGLDFADFNPAFDHIAAILEPGSRAPGGRARLLSADVQAGGSIRLLENRFAGDDGFLPAREGCRFAGGELQQALQAG